MKKKVKVTVPSQVKSISKWLNIGQPSVKKNVLYVATHDKIWAILPEEGIIADVEAIAENIDITISGEEE